MQPRTDWREIVSEGEAARFEGYARALRALQQKRARGGSPARGLHAKANAGVLAELTVASGLPDYARVGIFAEARTYRAYVRFSNGAGRRQHDRKGDVRGVAVKVLGAPGRKLIPGLEGAMTQDFLLIQSPSVPFRDADEFVWFVLAAERPALLLPRAIARFGLGRTIRILRAFVASTGRPVVSLATSRYYSAVPIKLGPCAVHYALEPHAHAEAAAKPGKSPDYLGEELAARLAQGPVTYDLRVQFFVDEARTPIEDASREWKEADAPFLTLARLELLPQAVASAQGRQVAEFIERLSFDPWHASEEMRPLGSFMRARSPAYRESAAERAAAAEPDGSERFD